MSSPNQTPLVLRGIFARPELQYSNWVATRKITHHTSSDEFSSRFSKTMGAHSENDGVRKNLEIFPKDSRHRSAFLAAVILEIFVRQKTHRSARFHCCPRCCREYQPGNKFVWWGVLSNLACYGTRSQNNKGGVLSSQPGSNGRWNVENHFSIICSSSRVFVVVVLFRIVHVFTGKNILCYMSKNLTQWKVLDYNAYIPGIYV